MRLFLIYLFNVVTQPMAPVDKTTVIERFVSPHGRDSWSGTLSAPNAKRTDGPFRTLQRARDEARLIRQATPRCNIAIGLLAGEYSLEETLIFDMRDSCPAGHWTAFQSMGKESPVVGSGVNLGMWSDVESPLSGLPEIARGRIWSAAVPEKLPEVKTLFAGECRLPRARGPGFTPPKFVDQRKYPNNRIAFPPGAMRRWPDLRHAELLVIPSADYEMSILPLADIDEAAGFATTRFPASRAMGKVKFYDITAWVENLFEHLDGPGKWVYRPVERRVYLWPLDNKRPENIVAPMLTELVRIEGNIRYDEARDQPVRGIRFRGLTFQHTERLAWHGFTGWSLQHHWEMFDRPSAALRLRGAEDCAIERCNLHALGGCGIRLDLHCQNNRISECQIADAGGVGICLAGYGSGTKDANRLNVVADNWIHHIGRTYWASPAIFVWQSGSNRIAHNLIHNVPYSAIAVSGRLTHSPDILTSDGARTVRWKEVGDPNLSIEWADRERFLHARGNLVESNDIHHVMETMGDGDGVYVSGAGGRNMVRGNFIHDCDSDQMADGIRCDDFQEEVSIEGNLLARLRCIGQGICSKGRNDIVGNVIYDIRPSRRPIRPERRTRGHIGLVVNPVAGSRIERNVVVATNSEYPIYFQHRIYGQGGEPRLRECHVDWNLYHCVGDANWGELHLTRERPFGIEKNSRVADPKFVNPLHNDFRWKADSPALEMGIAALEAGHAGPRPGHPFLTSKDRKPVLPPDKRGAQRP